MVELSAVLVIVPNKINNAVNTLVLVIKAKCVVENLEVMNAVIMLNPVVEDSAVILA